jgi:type II secretory pathway pseudopilin PulG
LVVSTIMIVLTAIGLVSYRQVNQNARNSKRRADLETVRQALVLYRTDQGSYPNTTSFSSMLTTISTYLNSPTMQDPQNTGTYVYRYTASGGGAGFSLCADLEPSGTDYCVSNP